MTKMTLASYPHMLGFEQLERLLERTAKTGNEGYPPFNIEQSSDRSYLYSYTAIIFILNFLQLIFIFTIFKN